MKRVRRSSLARSLSVLGMVWCLFLVFPPAGFSQDLILVGETVPGCNHEVFFGALARDLLPGYKLEVINWKLPDCEGRFYGPAPSLEWALGELLKKPPTVVYFGFILVPKPQANDRLSKLMDAVSKRHLAMVPGGNPGLGGVGVDSVDSCDIAPAGTNPLHVGLHSRGSLDRTPEEAKCIDLFVEIKGGARQVFLPDGSGPWFVAGTSTTGLLAAAQAARMRHDLGLPLEKIRSAFKLGGGLLSEDDLFAPRVKTLSLVRETRGRKVFSVIAGKVSGPAAVIELYRGVNCGPGAPLLARVPHTGGSFRFETQALVSNVCARVAGSSALPIGTSLGRTSP